MTLARQWTDGTGTQAQTRAQRYLTRSEALIIQRRDGSFIEEPRNKREPNQPGHYYAEVASDDLEEQSNVVERIIAMAFDVLGARHLEVRVRGSEQHAHGS